MCCTEHDEVGSGTGRGVWETADGRGRVDKGGSTTRGPVLPVDTSTAQLIQTVTPAETRRRAAVLTPEEAEELENNVAVITPTEAEELENNGVAAQLDEALATARGPHVVRYIYPIVKKIHFKFIRFGQNSRFKLKKVKLNKMSSLAF